LNRLLTSLETNFTPFPEIEWPHPDPHHLLLQ